MTGQETNPDTKSRNWETWGAWLGAVAMLGIGMAVFVDRFRAFHNTAPFDADGQIERMAAAPIASVDPSEAADDFARIYPALVAYAKEHGRLPSRNDLTGEPNPARLLGLDPQNFRLPDLRQTVHYGASDLPNHYNLSFLNLRPDGNSKPPFPEDGERDVWLVSTMHHRNGEPVHVLLWSDGAIETVSSRKAVKLPMEAGHATVGIDLVVYPGQAGLTPEQLHLVENMEVGITPMTAELAVAG